MATRKTKAKEINGELDHGMLPGLLGYQIRLAQRAVFRDFEAATSEFGISPGRVGVLVLIEANPGMTQSRLAEAEGLDRSTMVAVLDQLQDKGYIERRQGEDRRTNGLWLTAEGKSALAKLKRRIQAHEARIVQRLSAEERRVLVELLKKLGP